MLYQPNKENILNRKRKIRIIISTGVLLISVLSLLLLLLLIPRNKEVPIETYINCNDLSVVEKLEAAGIKFNCFQNADKKVLKQLSVDSSVNDINSSTKKISDTTDDDDKECPEGYTFFAAKNDCIVNDVLPRESKPESYFNPNAESLSSRKCEEGYVFNLDKGECQLDSKIHSVNEKPLIPIDDDEEIITTLKCRSGTIYSPQVDLCLPTKPEAVAQPPQLESLEVAFVPHPTKGCPKGSVYSPEIDHCLKIELPPKSSSPKDEIDSVLISDQNNHSTIFDATSSKKHDYEVDREARDVPEVSKNEASKPKQDKRSASDPTQLSLQPLTHEAIGWDMCKPDEVYVSEIDLCLKP